MGKRAKNRKCFIACILIVRLKFLSKIAHFKIFCLENYKNKNKLKGEEALRLFEKYDVLNYINSFYDVLHTLGEQYIVANIEEFINNRKSK